MENLSGEDSPKKAGHAKGNVVKQKQIKHTKQYYRIVFLLIISFFLFLIVRALVVPPSWGEFGFYRGDNIQEQMGLPITFAKPGSCKDCHQEAVEIHGANAHKNVKCQNCHAPLPDHIENGEFKALMPINKSPELCIRCHRYLPSRPKVFPQINVKEHINFTEQDIPDGFCLTCHKAHDPIITGAKDEEEK